MLSMAKVRPPRRGKHLRLPRRRTPTGGPWDTNKGLIAVQDALDSNCMAGKSPGNKQELAEALGITKQAISQWPHVPYDRHIEVADILGVSVTEIRPDFYSNQAQRVLSRGLRARKGKSRGK